MGLSSISLTGPVTTLLSVIRIYIINIVLEQNNFEYNLLGDFS